ncbi:signal peptidase I [Lachnospiraceae bacterium oral taxon 500]|nr:signal peptidase I [Lachnospiraceae bacterium oral taxon 500]
MENEKSSQDLLSPSDEKKPNAVQDSAPTPEGEEEKKFNWKREILDLIKVIVIALLITNFLNIFVFTLSQVRQSSMETTLIGGDQLIVEKLSYAFGNPETGDIIVFIKDPVDPSIGARFVRLYQDMAAKFFRREVNTRLVKRVIGLPGDEINIRDGKVFVNGKELAEDYAQQPTYPKDSIQYPFTVPDGQYFVIGDNRGMSYDSRDFGCIKREQIEGRVWIRFWPLGKLGGV